MQCAKRNRFAVSAEDNTIIARFRRTDDSPTVIIEPERFAVPRFAIENNCTLVRQRGLRSNSL